jgi:hypothetical protein
MQAAQHLPTDEWVTLTARRSSQNEINMGKLARLPGDTYHYRAVNLRPGMPGSLCQLRTSTASDPDGDVLYEEVGGSAQPGTHCFSSIVAEEHLQFKAGAEVIATSGISDCDIPNSSRGRVIGFRPAGSVEEEDLLDDEACMRRFNCTVDEVKEWWPQMCQGRQWPVVQFTVVSYNEEQRKMVSTKKVVTVFPKVGSNFFWVLFSAIVKYYMALITKFFQKFTVAAYDSNDPISARIQVPLQLAWALTVW